MSKGATAESYATIHVDESVVPKLALLGGDVAPAFEAWLTRARAVGRATGTLTAALDDKLDVTPLTPSADVLTWWLACDLAYVWDVVPRASASTSAAGAQCIVDPRKGQLRVAMFELPHLGTDAASADGTGAVSFPTRVIPEDLRRIGVPESLLVT